MINVKYQISRANVSTILRGRTITSRIARTAKRSSPGRASHLPAANGPIRVMFELVYDPFDVNGMKVSKVLRVSLDAGSQLNHFQPLYRALDNNAPLAVAIGLKKAKDEQRQVNAERGWVTIWQPMDKDLGRQGLAVVMNAADVDKLAEDARNNLIVLKPKTAFPFSYWAGFAWDRAGRVTSAEAWNKYVDEFGERVRSPIEIALKP